MGSLQQARQLEHRVLSSQQDALLWRNDISVRIEQLRQDLEAAKHHQRHRDEAVDAVSLIGKRYLLISLASLAH